MLKYHRREKERIFSINLYITFQHTLFVLSFLNRTEGRMLLTFFSCHGEETFSMFHVSWFSSVSHDEADDDGLAIDGWELLFEANKEQHTGNGMGEEMELLVDSCYSTLICWTFSSLLPLLQQLEGFLVNITLAAALRWASEGDSCFMYQFASFSLESSRRDRNVMQLWREILAFKSTVNINWANLSQERRLKISVEISISLYRMSSSSHSHSLGLGQPLSLFLLLVSEMCEKS